MDLDIRAQQMMDFFTGGSIIMDNGILAINDEV